MGAAGLGSGICCGHTLGLAASCVSALHVCVLCVWEWCVCVCVLCVCAWCVCVRVSVTNIHDMLLHIYFGGILLEGLNRFTLPSVGILLEGLNRFTFYRQA